MSRKGELVNIFDSRLDKNEANYASLSPIQFLRRSAFVYPKKIAVIYETQRFTYEELFSRCCSLAAALMEAGVLPGDTVAVMAPNVPPMLECHYGVPMTGAVLNTINTRLDSLSIAFILEHSQAKIFIVDHEYASVVLPALERLNSKPMVIGISDSEPSSITVGEQEYETFLKQIGNMNSFSFPTLRDEWKAISLCYTSGTTGNPKGVVGHHRGAYLNSLSAVLGTGLDSNTIYLWTLPMFHCNGWCFTWAVTAVAGTHVCLRKVETTKIFDAIVEHDVNIFCGAPVILTMLLNSVDETHHEFDHNCEVYTGGAAPPTSVISGMEKLG
ncbi:uncharacterized protein METZ01_LOCUS313261, partial [marine metagenome]